MVSSGIIVMPCIINERVQLWSKSLNQPSTINRVKRPGRDFLCGTIVNVDSWCERVNWFHITIVMFVILASSDGSALVSISVGALIFIFEQINQQRFEFTIISKISIPITWQLVIVYDISSFCILDFELFNWTTHCRDLTWYKTFTGNGFCMAKRWRWLKIWFERRIMQWENRRLQTANQKIASFRRRWENKSSSKNWCG